MKKVVLCLAALALAFPLLAADAKSPIKPGKWEMTMEMEIPGAPIKMPPVKFSHCVTKEQAETPENAVPKGDKKSDCKVSDMKIVGNKVSYTVSCPKQNVSMDAEMKYTDDSFEGTMKMRMEGQPEMTQKYSGKRLGDCEK